MVRETFEPGKTASMVARLHGVNPNQLFHWRKLFQDGSLSAVSAGEEVVPASELADALKQIKELQRLLDKKTMGEEIGYLVFAVDGPQRHYNRETFFAVDKGSKPPAIILMQNRILRLILVRGDDEDAESAIW